MIDQDSLPVVARNVYYDDLAIAIIDAALPSPDEPLRDDEGREIAHQKTDANGFLEGEYTVLPEFPEQHEVSAEESAIFEAAVDGYPMLHAKAAKVAVRAIPNGTEYLFTAVDLPCDGAPEMPAHELQVYVTVANGETPVFMQVIR